MHDGSGADNGSQLRAGLIAGLPLAIIGFLALRDGGFGLVERHQVAVALWWGLALALAFGLVPRATPPRGWRLAAGGFAALAALALLSAAWGPSTDRAVEEASRAVGYLAVVAALFAGLGPRSWRTAAPSLFVVAVAVTAYAVAGRLVPAWAPAGEAAPALDNGRLHAPLGYWNALGAWAAMTLAMALAWSADARGRRLRAMALAVVPLAGLCLYLTYSRGGVLAAAVGLGLVLALTRNRLRAAAHALGGALACLVVIAVVRATPEVASGTGDGGGAVTLVLLAAMVACAWLGYSTRGLGRRGIARTPGARRAVKGAAVTVACALVLVGPVVGKDGFGHGGDSAALTSSDPSARLTTAAGNRSAYWAEALAGFAARPLRGEGVGGFEYRWAAFGAEAELVVDAHSLVLGTAAELGLLGIVALAALVAGLLVIGAAGLAAARRNAQAVGLAAAAGCFAVSAAIDWTWQMAALGYLALAAVVTLAMAAATPLGPAARAAAGRWRAGLAVAAVAAGAFQVPALVSTALVQDAAEQRSLGDARDALALSDDAVRAAPWSAAAHAARAEAHLALGELDAAASDVRAAVDAEPRDAAHRLLGFRVEAVRGDAEAALAELRRARELSPRAPSLRAADVVALELQLAGRSAREP